MSPIRFYTDEDIYAAVAVQLRANGFDSVSVPEAGRLGLDDLSQLTWACQQGRTLITFNVEHFARLHHDWMNQGLSHLGIVVSQQRPIGDVLRRILHLGQTLCADDMRDRLEFLSNW